MKPFLSTLSLLSLTFLTASQGFGQAIVGYGINVGRAGAAGAGAGAAGAGAAGIFKRLGNQMGEQPKNARTARTAQPEFDPEELERARAEREPTTYHTAGSVKTESGFTISGLSSRRASPTRVRYAAPSNDYAAPTPTSGASQASPAGAASTQQAESAPAATSEESEAATPSEASASVIGAPEATDEATQAPAGTSIREARRAGSGTEELNPALERVLEVDSEIADIAAGTEIQELVKRFGQPLFKMAGIAGQGYNEKYIFRAPDGRRFTVFALDGAVADVIIEPAEFAAL